MGGTVKIFQIFIHTSNVFQFFQILIDTCYCLSLIVGFGSILTTTFFWWEVYPLVGFCLFVCLL